MLITAIVINNVENILTMGAICNNLLYRSFLEYSIAPFFSS